MEVKGIILSWWRSATSFIENSLFSDESPRLQTASFLAPKQSFMSPPINALDEVRTYKPFIDGLRAIAILTVVGSHFDFPGLSGGFGGVDVFFVISGYLIINQITSDIRRGRFSLLDFYARRTLRILPAFLLVSVTTLALATTIFVQPEVKEFAESFLLSTLMLANHHYLAHQGYFDTAAFTKPLLHMWSLGVEEQFYWVTPLLLLGMTATVAKAGPDNAGKIWVAITASLAVVSFLACVAFTYPAGRPNVSFYIMPTRGWEFILGGIVPALLPALRKRPAWTADALGWAGMAAIAVAAMLFDANTLYPSYLAAVPALGAMLIIAGGLLDSRSVPARALAIWPMVRIGLISYSLYLWHWPLISFVRTMNYGQQNVPQEIFVVALAFILACLTYRFIEFPVRQWRRNHSLRPGAIVAIGIAACVLIASIGYVWAFHIAPRFLPAIAGLEAVKAKSGEVPPVRYHGLLLGDSHVNAIQPYLLEQARQAGAQLTVFARAGCPPLLQTAVTTESGALAAYCPPFYRQVQFGNAEFAIVFARWNYFLGLLASDPYYPSARLLPMDGSSNKANPYDVFEAGLTAELAELKKAGVQRVLVIGPVPEFPWYAPYCVMRSIRVGVDSCSIARTTVDARRKRTLEVLGRVIGKFANVRLIDPIDLFCTEKVCSPHSGRTLYFSDTNHLSTAGTERLYKAYEHDFLWALTGNAAIRK